MLLSLEMILHFSFPNILSRSASCLTMWKNTQRQEKAHLSYVQHICIAKQGHWDINFLVLTPVTSGGHLMRRGERKAERKNSIFVAQNLNSPASI